MGKKFCTVENKWCKLLQHGICKPSNAKLEDVNKCPRIAAIETTTLYTLIREVKFEDVFERICHYYEDQRGSKDGYEAAFNELLTKKQKKHKLGDLFISVDVVHEDDSDWLDVYGIDKNKPIRYGIEFCPWNEWVTMFITNETLTNLSKEDVVAGCLWEMTFFGFSEKRVQEENEKMDKSVEEAKKLI